MQYIHSLTPLEICNNAHHRIKGPETSCIKNLLKTWFNLAFLNILDHNHLTSLFPQVASQIGVRE